MKATAIGLLVGLAIFGFACLMATLTVMPCQARGGEFYNGHCMQPGLRK